jgi:hypothetical protein
MTAKYLSDRIGRTEILETDKTTSMGVADDSVSLMQRTRETDLVLPSEIMNLEDLKAYFKTANYSITKFVLSTNGIPRGMNRFSCAMTFCLKTLLQSRCR